MQVMTDNPRAFYEYLIQNKINENHQIIGWFPIRKCEKLKYKNVKLETAENKYGWSSPFLIIMVLLQDFFSIQTIQLYPTLPL